MLFAGISREIPSIGPAALSPTAFISRLDRSTVACRNLVFVEGHVAHRHVRRAKVERASWFALSSRCGAQS